MVTRRNLVIAAPAAALLAGCGAGAEEDVPEPLTQRVTSVQGDVELLTAAIHRERGEAGLYAAHEIEVARRFEEIEKEHAQRLEAALGNLGAPPPPPQDTLGFSGDPIEAAINAEADAIAFWLDTIPKLYDPKLRTLATGILTVEAEQMAVLRAAMDLPPAPDPFVYGWTRHDAG